MKSKIVGKCKTVQLDKRSYFPGVKLKTACPKCKAKQERDFGDDYLSYPEVGKRTKVGFDCQECNVEWTVDVIVDLSLRLAPEKGKPVSRNASILFAGE